jgi:membrane protein insertase Oxa1/YidC/SpoIIIJ
MLFGGFLRHTGMILITLLFSFLAAMLVQSPVFYILFELGNGFIGFTENEFANHLVELGIVFISLVTLFCGIEFIILNTIMNYRSIKEIKEATGLMKAIENLKISRR